MPRKINVLEHDEWRNIKEDLSSILEDVIERTMADYSKFYARFGYKEKDMIVEYIISKAIDTYVDNKAKQIEYPVGILNESNMLTICDDALSFAIKIVSEIDKNYYIEKTWQRICEYEGKDFGEIMKILGRTPKSIYEEEQSAENILGEEINESTLVLEEAPQEELNQEEPKFEESYSEPELPNFEPISLEPNENINAETEVSFANIETSEDINTLESSFDFDTEELFGKFAKENHAETVPSVNMAPERESFGTSYDDILSIGKTEQSEFAVEEVIEEEKPKKGFFKRGKKKEQKKVESEYNEERPSVLKKIFAVIIIIVLVGAVAFFGYILLKGQTNFTQIIDKVVYPVKTFLEYLVDWIQNLL